MSRTPSEFVEPSSADYPGAVDLLVREGPDDEEEDEEEDDDEEDDDEEGEDDGNSDGYSE